ncbi:3D domain-containing protein [Cohnella lubricantis]|uniref:LysM peptidoglycan-binding domain-containing protein n=1 Tax=Cohnella lubricantis TaxID=2163172 RepID=A0A841TBD6_9BACL|nr:3D domain-containing protein [Cohnella lubricantis]MBB6678322.1 LysM peptidoglycan-binding domain-containing protein [Cohnella lubricantis]MBP2118525.1 3D (Asp-Asp-Asp) domain-containing protein [Cohnella lubricantis]
MAFNKKLGTRTLALALGGALLLPSMSAFAATPYTAKDGDTFWSLSKKFGVSLEKIMKLNPKVDPLNVYQGLTLSIPATDAQNAAAGKQAALAKKAAAAAASVKAVNVSAQSVTTSDGLLLSYSKVIDMKASAYSASNEENAWGPVDYFGNPLKLGTIAVDPKVIPFGTKVYITGYSFSGLPTGGMIATATDAGSAIKGNRVDIFVPGSRESVAKFGFQQVKLYVLK